MYIQSIELEHTGPIEYLKIQFPANNAVQKPTVFVGSNGSGKSILLSFIVNFLVAAKQTFFDDVEVEKGKVYKLRSPTYICYGKHFYYANVTITNDIKYEEWQLDQTREDFETIYEYTSIIDTWEKIESNDSSAFLLNFVGNQAKLNTLKSDIDTTALLYFPSNRFEDPAWLNIESLNFRVDVTPQAKFSSISDRNIIATNQIKNLCIWIYDILYETTISEVRHQALSSFVDGKPCFPLHVQTTYSGPNNDLLVAIRKILGLIFNKIQHDDIKINIGPKHNRQLGINFYTNNKSTYSIPNIFSFSTGESLLFCMFCSILRDSDLSLQRQTAPFNSKGIVLIDEIDLHLHIELQRNVLPKLIKMFPNIQFIVTTHSPSFLIGMDEEFGGDGYDIYELPNGEKISSNRFSEFENAYEFFKETKIYEEEIQSIIAQYTNPIVLTEGKTDAVIIKNAWNKLFTGSIMPFSVMSCGIEIGEENRSGSADVLRKSIEFLSTILNQPVIGLFDNDIEGNTRFKGLNKKIFEEYSTSKFTRKHNTKNIWGILLPVPESRSLFVTESDINQRYLEIEHYFSDALLDSYGKKGPSILGSDVFNIIGNKTDFSEKTACFSTTEFLNFHLLFQSIKDIFGPISQEGWPF